MTLAFHFPASSSPCLDGQGPDALDSRFRGNDEGGEKGGLARASGLGAAVQFTKVKQSGNSREAVSLSSVRPALRFVPPTSPLRDLRRLDFENPKTNNKTAARCIAATGGHLCV